MAMSAGANVLSYDADVLYAQNSGGTTYSSTNSFNTYTDNACTSNKIQDLFNYNNANDNTPHATGKIYYNNDYHTSCFIFA